MSVVTIISGSNVGDRSQNLKTAFLEVQSNIGILTASSSVYETAPWGFDAEKAFFNQVFVISTKLDALTVLQKLLEIEHRMGRDRNPESRYSSRSIDLDILFYDNVVLKSEGLTIPHPRIAERRFVLVPLTEILPDFIHPVLGKTLLELLKENSDSGSVNILK